MVALFTKKNKSAFTLVEALLGFFLFSFIMVLYVPSLTSELKRMDKLQDFVDQWHLFYDLVELEGSQGAKDLQEVLIDSFNEDHDLRIVSYIYNSEVAFVEFDDGSHLEVKVVEGLNE